MRHDILAFCVVVTLFHLIRRWDVVLHTRNGEHVVFARGGAGAGRGGLGGRRLSDGKKQ